MPNPRKISLVIVIAGLVIIAGILILTVLSPLPWMISLSVYGFLHQPNPDSVCLYPPVQEKTLDSVWGLIVNRTGIDASSAAFDELEARIAPDETVEYLALSFYATKDREGRMYTAYLRYDPVSCGTLKIQSYPADSQDHAKYGFRSPREILLELPSVRPSVFGISNQTVRITTGISQEINATYYSLPCTNLFLLENGTIAPLERIVLHDTRADVRHWNIFPQRCVMIPGHGTECLPDGSIFVFTGERLQSADLSLNTSQGRGITLRECPHGPTYGESCEQTFWGGTRCENWTVE